MKKYYGRGRMTEYLNVLDERGVKTGKRIEKKEAHARGIWHAAAHI